MWGSAIGEFLGSFVGVLGALFIFWLEAKRGQAEEQKARSRELAGILLLLYDEISGNREVLARYAQDLRLVWVFSQPLYARL
jgi:hypothetical protein